MYIYEDRIEKYESNPTSDSPKVVTTTTTTTTMRYVAGDVDSHEGLFAYYIYGTCAKCVFLCITTHYMMIVCDLFCLNLWLNGTI